MRLPLTSTNPPEPALRRARQVHLPWRIVFALYTLAMMVGIHWPRLSLGVGDVPAPDKIIHFIAFGGLTFFLWTTGWLPRLLVLWIVAMIWTFLAELTQAIPILGRTFSWWDIIAGWLGVTSVALWISALGPVGGAPSRLRHRFNWYIIKELFTRPSTWMLTAVVGGALAIILGGCAWFMLNWLDPMRLRLAGAGALVAALFGGVAGVFAMTDALLRRSRDAIADKRPCLECGSSCTNAEIDERGYGSCDQCGSKFHLGQWIQRLELPRTTIARLTLFPSSWIMLMVTLPVAGVWHFQSRPGGALSWVHEEVRLAGAVAIISVGLAFAIRAFRSNLTCHIDRQAERCRRCGHDVHATPAPHGVGRCGECGTEFVRL